MRLARHQIADLNIQRYVDLDRGQLIGHERRVAMFFKLGGQRLGAADRQARDLVEVVIEAFDAAFDAVEQAARSLLADPGYTGNVIDFVAHQREEVDDQLRADAELVLHAFDVIDATGHGVDQGDMRADQLGHVLVASGDDHVALERGTLPRQCSNHVVRLDAFNAQQWHTQRTHTGMQRLDLATQVVGHRWTMGLVFSEQRVSEGRALGVENHREGAVRILPTQRQQHVQHALHGAGGLAGRGGQRRQGVEGAVEVGRTVHQNEGRLAHEQDQPFRRVRS